MSLFVCDGCGCVENTALGKYWTRKIDGDGRALCSECDQGQWHGRFTKKPWDGKSSVINRPVPHTGRRVVPQSDAPGTSEPHTNTNVPRH